MTAATRAVGDDADSPMIAAVELGGTKCICLLARGPQDIQDKMVIPTGDATRTMAAIAAVITKWCSMTKVDAIGLGSFGPIELNPSADDYGRLLSTPKPGWSGTDLLATLTKRHGLPVGLATDVGAAATAEGRWGACIGLRNHAYVTVGTGVGVGIVVEGRRLLGLGHPEAGHMRVPRIVGDRWPGACIFHGDCVEGLASGFAIGRRAGRPAYKIPGEDPIWESVAEALTSLAENLFVTVSPERIVLGGSVMRQPRLLPRMRELLSDRLGRYGFARHFSGDMDDFLVMPVLGDDAGPMGAVAVGLEAYCRALA